MMDVNLKKRQHVNIDKNSDLSAYEFKRKLKKMLTDGCTNISEMNSPHYDRSVPSYIASDFYENLNNDSADRVKKSFSKKNSNVKRKKKVVSLKKKVEAPILFSYDSDDECKVINKKELHRSQKIHTEILDNIVNDSTNSSTIDLNDELANEIRKNIQQKKISSNAALSNQSSEEIKYCMISDSTSYNFLCNDNGEKFDFHNSAVEVFDKSPKKSINIALEKETVFECDDSSDVITPVEVSNIEEIEEVYKIFFITNACIIVLQHSSRVFFCGKLKASVLYGSVEVLGHRLTRKPEELYSVSSASLLCFETSKCEENPGNLPSYLRKLGVNEEKIDDIMTYYCNGDAVLLLEPLKNVMTDFVNKHLTNFNIFSRTKSPEIDDIFNILECKFYTSGSMSVFAKNKTWINMQDTISPMITTPKCLTMICGGKDVGKSTMLRYLVNKTLENGPALVLDFDPGQPEFTICGSISVTVVDKPLLGPNFTHLLEPEISLCLGFINVTENEKRYINAVVELIKFCRSDEKYNNMPWFVNTMGFITMKGYSLLTNIINTIWPTCVIEIKSFLPNQNFKTTLTAENVFNFQKSNDFVSHINDEASLNHDYNYILIEPFQCQTGKPPTVCKHIEAKSERLLNVLSYFSKMTSEKYASILHIKPYLVSLDALVIMFHNIHVDESYLPCILNGRIVSLCYEREPGVVKIRKLKDYPILCRGYGIIRGIDMSQRLLYILTPVDVDILKDVNVLVYADTLPDCSSVMSVPNMPSKMIVPYTAPLKAVSKHKHLHQIPKRKINPLRLIENSKRS